MEWESTIPENLQVYLKDFYLSGFVDESTLLLKHWQKYF
jgi:hypothetical protein